MTIIRACWKWVKWWLAVPVLLNEPLAAQRFQNKRRIGDLDEFHGSDRTITIANLVTIQLDLRTDTDLRRAIRVGNLTTHIDVQDALRR